MKSPCKESFSPDYPMRLQSLREEMKQQGLDAFLVPVADEYQNEYVPASAQRVAFLSGFTGSAGLIVVGLAKAAFFTDGRYTLQAAAQVPGELFAIHDGTKTSSFDWIKENIAAKAVLGFDPWLHTSDFIERMEKALRLTEITLKSVQQNPVDAIWAEHPEPPCEPIVAHDIRYAGRESADKRQSIAAELRKNRLRAAVITDPASVAWLLNVRGGDVPHTPLPLSTAIIYADGSVDWFVDSRKGASALNLEANVKIFENNKFAENLQLLGKEKAYVRVDAAEAPYAVLKALKDAGADVDRGDDPCAMPKACKNQTELDGFRAAHKRDGAALVKFLALLDQSAASGQVTELMAEEKLRSFRATDPLFRGLSFGTIMAAGAHGAIVHYRPTPETNAAFVSPSLLLIDSGAQYLDGTTDVTRTIAIGEPTAEMRDRFTRVLKGHIALASVVFPEGATGADLEVLARQYLWAQGLDYGHGTGHGIGSYLGVHESPPSISRRGNTPLKVGMVMSNEPGYYKADAYGIRIENVQTVVERHALGSPERKILGFETLTMAPIDRRLIEISMLSPAEREWLNSYHIRVCKNVLPLVDEATAVWLKVATGWI